MNNITKEKRQRSGGNSAGRTKQGFNRRSPRKKMVSSIRPEQLIKEATETEIVEYKSERTFDSMPISEELKQCLKVKGYVRPSEIQDKSIESLMDKRDILGIAETGTGKTAAFLIPIIEDMMEHRRKSTALVLLPTRELAMQVEDEFKSMTKGMGLYCASYIGGTNINTDLKIARRDSHIVIATPGRLLDLVQRGAIRLPRFNTLVLDEFDRMLDMGFVKDIKQIISGMKNRKHTMLFSATLDNKQQSLINEILNNHVTVKVSSGEKTNDHISQDVVRISEGEDKFAVLKNLISQESFEKVLVFEETKHQVKRLCAKLNASGITSDDIHGNKSQNARQNALNAFKSGKVKVLVATDVASRGIDVNDITHVINYQLPMTFDSYIHRIGRTGRAGKTGVALTFIN